MGIPRLPTLALLLLLPVAVLSLGGNCRGGPPFHERGHPLFLSPQSNPLALSADGTRLYVANTTSGTLSVLDVSTPAAPLEIAQVDVGMDPVGVAVRPKLVPGDPLEDELVLVTNHVSDSISVVSRQDLAVVQTVQALDAEGVTTTNEPVGVAFAGPSRAFVALDEPNQVLVLDFDAGGRAAISTTRLPVTAQAPRALAVAGDRLYVAAFESGNQTEFPTCAPGDPRGLDPLDPYDMGCELAYDFASVSTLLNAVNSGGRVILDRDLPDRDLFVFDTGTLALVDVVEGMGTLLYGVAAAGDRVFVTHTEARNLRNGLGELGNRMFENRLGFVDCLPGCTAFSAPVHWDLDARAGVPVPTPYGVAASTDGTTVVVTAAGSDGRPGLPGDPGVQIPGLVVLDAATGAVLGDVSVGALPQGVALRSDPAGAAEWGFVLDAADATVSVVDLRVPWAPQVVATLAVGSDPTPPAVRRGRIAFGAARASTSGTFACASCHPDGNVDQLLWTINTVAHPDDGPDATGVVADPRQTMPIRGLRGTLPLHWDGSLGDPFAGTSIPGDTAPDCDLSVPGGELACFRHLVDASLAGVMCRQLPGCPSGPTGLPGALDAQDRDDLATFLMAVSHPPPPARRPSGALSPSALEGARDFFTTDNGLGLSPDYTCGQPGIGCHELPLLAGTNNVNDGGDAPSFRGLWDRTLIFSRGFPSSQEVLELVQACADGVGPLDPCGDVVAMGGPTFDSVWDPAVGMTERGSLLVAVNTFDRRFTGLRGPELWSWVTELGVGLPALTGRQLELSPATLGAPGLVADMDAIEEAAAERRIVARARSAALGDWAYDPGAGRWREIGGPGRLSGAELRAVAAGGTVVTITAWPPVRVVPAGAAQPLLSPEVAADGLGNARLPRPPAGGVAVVRMAAPGVTSNASVLIDGRACAACTLDLDPAAEGVAVIGIDPVPAPGPHTLQVANPRGMESNEVLFVAE